MALANRRPELILQLRRLHGAIPPLHRRTNTGRRVVDMETTLRFSRGRFQERSFPCSYRAKPTQKKPARAQNLDKTSICEAYRFMQPLENGDYLKVRPLPMRPLSLTLLFASIFMCALCAEPFPTEGWWGVRTLQTVSGNVSVIFRLERYRPPPPKPIPSLDLSPDRLAVLREHPDEAWLLIFYHAEISVNAAESVQLFRSSIPARITGNRITLFTVLDPVPYQITNTPDGTELRLLDDAAHSFPMDLAGDKKATLRRLSPEAIEQMKKQVLTFFP